MQAISNRFPRQGQRCQQAASPFGNHTVIALHRVETGAEHRQTQRIPGNFGGDMRRRGSGKLPRTATGQRLAVTDQDREPTAVIGDTPIPIAARHRLYAP